MRMLHKRGWSWFAVIRVLRFTFDLVPCGIPLRMEKPALEKGDETGEGSSSVAAEEAREGSKSRSSTGGKKSGKARRREKRLRNEPRSVSGESLGMYNYTYMYANSCDTHTHVHAHL